MRFYPIGGGGVGDLDQVTAGAEHVLESKVIVDKDGNPITGTMANRTGTALTVATNGQTLIPQGYHDGTQYAKNTQATLAGGTLTPSTSQVTASCNGKLMTSNYVIPAFSLPSASSIIKGKSYSIYGKTVNGTFITNPFYLYNAGTWTGVSYDGTVTRSSGNGTVCGDVSSDGYIVVRQYLRNASWGIARITKVNLTNYNYLKFNVKKCDFGDNRDLSGVNIGVTTNSNATEKSQISPNVRLTYQNGAIAGTYTLNVSSLSGSYYIYVCIAEYGTSDSKGSRAIQIDKIWLQK